MQQAEEAAAEAEAERGAGLHLVAEAGIVEPQLADALAQFLEIRGVDREEAAEDHRLHFLVAGQRRVRPALHRGDGVADAGLLDLLDLRGDEADLARADFGQVGALGGEAADAVDQVLGAALHELDVETLGDDAVDYADEDDHAEVGVVPAVDQAGLERRVAVALRRRDLGDDGFEHVLDPDARFGGGEDGFGSVEADDLLDLLLDAFGLGRGEVDLVDDGDDFVVVLDRLVDIGERLRLDPLRGIDDQQRALACGEAARNFIGEVDVAGRVHQVELVGLAILRGVIEAHCLGLDGDAALALNVHIIKDLLAHLALGEAAAMLDQAIGKRRLAMVDMRDNAEVTYVGQFGHLTAPLAVLHHPVSHYCLRAELRRLRSRQV